MNTSEGHLLIVDDDPANRDMLSRRLGKSGYTFELAENGEQACARLDSSKFDLVLLDVNMPGLSGLEVLARIRKTRSMLELPVLLVTARTDSQCIVDGLDRGANDYITKPIDFPVALARIRNQQAIRLAEAAVRERDKRAKSIRELALRSVSAPDDDFSGLVY